MKPRVQDFRPLFETKQSPELKTLPWSITFLVTGNTYGTSHGTYPFLTFLVVFQFISGGEGGGGVVPVVVLPFFRIPRSWTPLFPRTFY